VTARTCPTWRDSSTKRFKPGRIVSVAQLAGGRLIVVDAIDDGAAAFYRKLDFIPVENNPHRLYMKVETARKVLRIGQ
jgi:hypothetical protein